MWPEWYRPTAATTLHKPDPGQIAAANMRAPDGGAPSPPAGVLVPGVTGSGLAAAGAPAAAPAAAAAAAPRSASTLRLSSKYCAPGKQACYLHSPHGFTSH